ncbi:EAL domain-containing protein (plasmid) [Paroceanicella profunda]|uniref:EAL domain-containing protein n=1 Tax=Paroceanicella profunda TaxID=2579971 RepID=A0A5B8FJN6_9RHOB|nr:EAL domain-containing protein [Paroceanicella profunda]QDL94647.1 EAL domain-containing protein [Paroceanicella profunda]
MLGFFTRSVPGPGAAVRAIRIVLAVVMICLLSAASYISVLVLKRQAALSHVSRYDVAFSAAQGLSEFLRLRGELYELALEPDSPSAADAVRLRYEILLSRLSLFEAGDFITFVQEDPERAETVKQISDRLFGLDSVIDDPAHTREALAATRPLEASFTGLVSAANSYGGSQVAREQRELFQLHWEFTGLAISLAVGGFILFVLNAWQNRLLVVAQKSLAETNAELREAGADLAAAVTEKQQANVELTVQNGLFETALDNMSHGLAMFDATGRVIVSNRRMAEIFRLKVERLRPGAELAELEKALIDAGACSAQDAREILSQHTMSGAASEPESFVLHLQDGRTIMLSRQPMAGGGWTATYEDITERHRAQAQIYHMARHDVLTDLPNRTLLLERFQTTLLRDRAAERLTAVMCIDLDNFKKINDTFGHPFGDKLLCQAALRLRAIFRDGDTISRVGGDEFTVVYGGLTSAEQANAIAERLADALSEPYYIGGHEVFCAGSIGIAVSENTAESVDELLVNADLALYQAKAAGRATYTFYTSDMLVRTKRRGRIESTLLSESFGEQFHLAFQPITDLATGRVTSVEGLVRWRHAAADRVSPQEVITVAEETGLIVDLGAWVLHEACEIATTLPEEINMAVNLSPLQFGRSNIVDIVSRTLKDTGLPARRLDLEITETLLLEDSPRIVDDLRALRALGARLSLDDFGTGYSSLRYLRRFAVDKIKIDRSFIEEIGRNRDHSSIVHAIINMANSLGIRTVAEGVETAEQLEIVRAAGCSEVQGYLISRPLRKAELDRFLTDRPGW